MKKYEVKVPKYCLYCGAGWKGGHQVPGSIMKLGLRVFYFCGASLSITEQTEDYCRLLFKNCGKQEEEE